MEGTETGKRSRSVSGGGGAELPDAKRMRDHILDVLNDDDDRGPAAGPELVTVMKSLADEIDRLPAPDPDLASESVGSFPDLGYLLGASDDELGLPPTSSDNGGRSSDKQSGGHVSVEAEAIKFDDLWAFEDDGDVRGGDGGVENQPVRQDAGVSDGLFDYSDGFCDPLSDFTDVPWRVSEFLSAL